MSYRITSPRIMQIGAGSCAEIPHILAMLGCRTPLIVTDTVMVGLGYADRISKLLDSHHINHGIFSDTVSEPSVKSIMTGLHRTCAGTDSLFPDAFDCLIALGGGSSIDSAKAISVLAKRGGKIRDYKLPINAVDEGLPVIAVPTTASGSEATGFSYITAPSSGEKTLFAGNGFCPAAVLIDFNLTRTVPSRIIADTGMDALTRAIESYVSRKANLFSDQQALAALQLIGPNIRQSVNQPDNSKAREAVMLGSTLAGSAFSQTCGALVHAMSSPLATFLQIPHSMANAMLLPVITDYSMSSAASRYATCARAMGIASQKDGDQTANAKLIDELTALNQELSIPRLAEYVINKERFVKHRNEMAQQAIAACRVGNNPRQPTYDEIIRLYEKVWQQQ